jgi:hypothetical protein
VSFLRFVKLNGDSKTAVSMPMASEKGVRNCEKLIVLLLHSKTNNSMLLVMKVIEKLRVFQKPSMDSSPCSMAGFEWMPWFGRGGPDMLVPPESSEPALVRK